MDTLKHNALSALWASLIPVKLTPKTEGEDEKKGKRKKKKKGDGERDGEKLRGT